jgi:hypothetical protein
MFETVFVNVIVKATNMYDNMFLRKVVKLDFSFM